MKKNALLLACRTVSIAATLAASLVACEATTVTSAGPATSSTTNSTTNSGSTDSETSIVATESESTTANEIINSVGLIKLEPIGSSPITTRGLFGNLPEPRTAQAIRDWYIPPTDNCNVTILSQETPIEFQVIDQSATLISAGESLVLSDDNGTYATLQRTTGQTGPLYQPEIDLNQPPAQNLSVDIPGEQFRAFPDVAIPIVPELQLVTPAVGENVGVATFFQWQPNNQSGSRLGIFTSGVSSVFNEAIVISCNLVDDGLFGFPEEIQALMGPGYDDNWTSVLRIVYNVTSEDDTLVVTAASVRAN